MTWEEALDYLDANNPLAYQAVINYINSLNEYTKQLEQDYDEATSR